MFKGEATDEEVTLIRRWVNECDKNREMFFRERTLFDAIQLNTFCEAQSSRTRRISLWKRIGSIAAAAACLFLLYNMIYQGPEMQTVAAYNTVTVPPGQRVELLLADGTHVWLNSRSELSYPSAFNNDQREIYLKGEAFFDVAKDRDKKFIVHTSHCEIEVLGTQFNVEAYNDNEFSTALLRGSVKVTNKFQPDESVMLSPNNTVRLDKGKLTVVPITDFNSYTWKEGLITFRDINFKDLMKKLEKNYGIRIIIENPRLDNYACSGKLRISDEIEEVLRALQQDAHFIFEWEGKTIIHIQ